MVSLIVTIIVLLILTGITIASINGHNGLIGKALLAKNSYKNVQDDENSILDSYETEISKTSRDGSESSIHETVTIDGDEYFVAGVDATKNGENIESTLNGNGFSILNSNGNINMNVILKKKVTNFDYTGGEQSYTAPVSGYYLLECWGASGGNGSSEYIGGYGSYSQGIVKLKKDEVIYINIGGKGNSASYSSINGGYNGGGTAYSPDEDVVGSGGGATHIASKSGLLKDLSEDINEILIVSGGGGGGYHYRSLYNGKGGHAGGFTGNISYDYTTGGRKYNSGTQASQTAAGTGSGAGGKSNSRSIWPRRECNIMG